MNYHRIKSLQSAYGVDELQNDVNNGSVWKFEGSKGRVTMSLLEDGVIMLPKEPTFDYYGNRIPSRDDLKKGTKGTFQNAVRFWSEVDNGNIEYIDYLNKLFY